MWNSIDDPNKLRTILGLFPEYKAVDKLICEERYQNPSVITCLYNIDSETIGKVKNSLLIIKMTHLDTTIHNWLDECRTFLSKEKYEDLYWHYQRVKGHYVNEIQKLGQPIQGKELKMQEEPTSMGQVQKFWKNVVGFFKSNKEPSVNEDLENFKSVMEQILFNYIKLDLNTSENLLIATIKRASKVA